MLSLLEFSFLFNSFFVLYFTYTNYISYYLDSVGAFHKGSSHVLLALVWIELETFCAEAADRRR